MEKRNERGAGRKPMFTEKQIAEIRAKREQGAKVSDLAKVYGVSRQTISAYLNKQDRQMEAIVESLRVWREFNRPFQEVNVVDYTMRMDFMCEDECCTQILVDFRHEKVAIRNQMKWLQDGYWYKADQFGYESLADFIPSGFHNIPLVSYHILF